MAVITLPAVDPAEVRAAAGYSQTGTWYSPRHKRPAALRAMQGRPTPEHGQPLSWRTGESA